MTMNDEDESVEKRGGEGGRSDAIRLPAPGELIVRIGAEAGGGSAARLLSSLLTDAIEAGASDLHITPMDDGFTVRRRVDGALLRGIVLPEETGRSLLGAVKLWADLQLDEARRALKGWFTVRSAAGTAYNVRAHILPTTRGESAVLSIIDAHSVPSWEEIGLSEAFGARALLQRPRGLVLFAGPAGSGKTTVMYAALKALDREQRSVVLIDEDAGLQIDNVLRAAPGADISAQLRNLANDYGAEVIGITELNGAQAVDAALEIGMSGRTIYAGFYAEDSIDATRQIRGMPISSRPIGAGLAGVISSRLVRRICTACAEAYSPPPEQLASLGIAATDDRYMRGAGCDQCHGTGYKGRVMIYEVVSLYPSMARMLEERPGQDTISRDLREAAANLGQTTTYGECGVTLRTDAAAKVKAGITTVEEALRVLGERRA